MEIINIESQGIVEKAGLQADIQFSGSFPRDIFVGYTSLAYTLNAVVANTEYIGVVCVAGINIFVLLKINEPCFCAGIGYRVVCPDAIITDPA